MGSTLQMNIEEQMEYVDLSLNEITFDDEETLCRHMTECPKTKDILEYTCCTECIGNAPTAKLETIEEPLTMENLKDRLITWKVLFK